ncbi:hypothetical protein CDL12_21766 [Handroanthus impetiginosus]|uniref:Uncharacterized protein n=1 Tax=Handroanthus impetiginosus TaxID=429701 RepID=A0A2G9GKF4_9LAMI|nr:hypothetical protein CDL12_21766 [Handroanthus impetiginosus]
MTQFSGEGGSRYFDPKEARKRIYEGDSTHSTYNMITKNKNLLFVDNGKARELEYDYFIAIRLNYLPLRQGERFIIEPYSPHRFSYQFGYYHKVLGILRNNPFTINLMLEADLEYGLHYCRLCTLFKSISKAWFPKGVNSPIDNDNDVQIVEITESLKVNKSKSTSHSSEESGSTDSYWKRSKRDLETLRQTDVDGNEIGNNPSPTEGFAKKILIS